MLYWLGLFLVCILKCTIAYPDFYSMPEEIPNYYPNSNNEDNYVDYSDNNQWNPLELNYKQESPAFSGDMDDSRKSFYSTEEYVEDETEKPLKSHHRILKIKTTLKTKKPSKMVKPYRDRKYKYQKAMNDYDDYETDEDTEKLGNSGTHHLPSKATVTKKILHFKKNPANDYQNKRSQGNPLKVHVTKNSQNDDPEMTNNIFKGKKAQKLENSKRNLNKLKINKNNGESVADSKFNGKEIYNLGSKKHSKESLGNVYNTDEAITNEVEAITKINNQIDGTQNKIEKGNGVFYNSLQDYEQYADDDSESSSNKENGAELINTPSNNRKDNLVSRNINTENDQKFVPEFVKLDKIPRALNQNKSLAVPKLTFYNENQSNSEIQITTDKMEFTTEKMWHSSKDRMVNDKLREGRYLFHKRHKTKYGRDSSPNLEQQTGINNQDFEESLNHKITRERAESAYNHEDYRDKFDSNDMQKKSNGPKSYDNLSNNYYTEGDFIKNEPDDTLKVRKSAGFELNNRWKDSKTHIRRNSAKNNESDSYLSKKRSVEIRDVTTGKVNAIHFEKNIESGEKTTMSPETTENFLPLKTHIRNPKKLKARKRKNKHNKSYFSNRQRPSSPDYSESYNYPNDYYPEADIEYSNEGYEKRAPGLSSANDMELKELSDPNSYELSIAKQFKNNKAKMDEKLSRTVEDHKVKKTILKDAKTRKETDIIENENERLTDNVHVISDPNEITPKPAKLPYLPGRPINPLIEQIKTDEEEKSEKQLPESDILDEPPIEQVAVPSKEVEGGVQNESENEPGEEYYEGESKEIIAPGNSEDTNGNQGNEAPVGNTESVNVENNANPEEANPNPEVGPDIESESVQLNQENNEDGSKTTTEIPPEEESIPKKKVNKYRPKPNPETNVSPKPVSKGKKYPPLRPGFESQNLNKNGMFESKYKLPDGKGKKHKKIYNFSTEYMVSDGMDEFEKEEKLEKASKTVVKNKLITANESSHHFQERKTEIKHNKESYHEALIEEKDESKFPRDMGKSDLQRSLPTSSNDLISASENNNNSNLEASPVYPRSSGNDKNLEPLENHEYGDQIEREYSGGNSKRYSPSDELNQHDELIDDVKRSQSSVKTTRDTNSNFFANDSEAQENNKNVDSNSEESLGKNKETRDSEDEDRRSSTPRWTTPDPGGRSGNVVYITLKTTTVDLERKYHDFINIQDGKRNARQSERHPKHYIRKRRKNRKV